MFLTMALSLRNQQVKNFYRCLNMALIASEGLHCQRMEVIETTSARHIRCVGNNLMKKKTTTHSISRTEMIELGILGLGLSLAVTAGFVALLSSLS